jgi:hypothetical protein
MQNTGIPTIYARKWTGVQEPERGLSSKGTGFRPGYGKVQEVGVVGGGGVWWHQYCGEQVTRFDTHLLSPPKTSILPNLVYLRILGELHLQASIQYQYDIPAFLLLEKRFGHIYPPP